MAATLSSALACFLGAPRVLQSLAKDDIFPFLATFGAGSGKTGNPRRAVFPTLAIALAVVAIGNLNAIAAVVSMFFLASYGLLNYATYFEARAASPSFRPTFRFFDYRLALLAAIACVAAMLAINIVAGVAALAIVFCDLPVPQASGSARDLGGRTPRLPHDDGAPPPAAGISGKGAPA